MIAIGVQTTALRGRSWKRVHKKTCVCCHRPFETTHGNQRTCSQSCGSRWARMKGDRAIGRFLCRYCGQWYIPKTKARTTFCSRDCSFAWMHARKEFRRRLDEGRPPKEPQSCKICGEPLMGQARRACSKACRKEMGRRRAQETYTPAKPRPIECEVCGKTFKVKGGRKYCKPCRKIVDRLWKATQKTKRRARIAAVLIETFDNREVLERDGWRCQICGRKLRKAAKYPHPQAATVDHIIPLALGGEHSLRNVQCACRQCNGVKSATVGGSQLRMF